MNKFKIETYLISKDFDVKVGKTFKNYEDKYEYILNNFDYLKYNNNLLISLGKERAVDILTKDIANNAEPKIIIRIYLESEKNIEGILIHYKTILGWYNEFRKDLTMLNMTVNDVKENISKILTEEEYEKAFDKFCKTAQNIKKSRIKNEKENLSYHGYDMLEITLKSLQADKPFTAIDTILLLRSQIIIGARNVLSIDDINCIIKTLYDSDGIVKEAINGMMDKIINKMPDLKNSYDACSITKIICLITLLHCALEKYKVYLNSTNKDFYGIGEYKKNSEQTADEIAEDILNEVRNNGK